MNFSYTSLVPDFAFDETDIDIVCRKNTPKNKNKRKNLNDDAYFDDIFSDDDDNYDNQKNKDNCDNPNCDHKVDKKYTNKINLDSIKSIDDIISLGETYHCKNNTTYCGLDLKILYDLVAPLKELKDMVGMSNVKESMIDQILFFLQDLSSDEKKDMMHTVLTGPPGVGKTELGKILAKVYKAMGILSSGHVVVASRSDLIGKYLGHTAAKTQSVIDKAKGGVLFIDEAYSLGNPEQRDSFSKECLDTINQNLSENRDFLCIIAGYEENLDTCFFSYNPGLKRRFTFRYNIWGYTPEELKQIFELKVRKDSWRFEYDIQSEDDAETVMKKHNTEQKVNEFFVVNSDYFPHYGGDVETLYLNCRIQHSRRVMFLGKEEKKALNLEDIQKGFDNYVANRRYAEENREKDSFMFY